MRSCVVIKSCSFFSPIDWQVVNRKIWFGVDTLLTGLAGLVLVFAPQLVLDFQVRESLCRFFFPTWRSTAEKLYRNDTFRHALPVEKPLVFYRICFWYVIIFFSASCSDLSPGLGRCWSASGPDARVCSYRTGGSLVSNHQILQGPGRCSSGAAPDARHCKKKVALVCLSNNWYVEFVWFIGQRSSADCHYRYSTLLKGLGTWGLCSVKAVIGSVDWLIDWSIVYNMKVVVGSIDWLIDWLIIQIPV